jgi:hypothetical protein
MDNHHHVGCPCCGGVHMVNVSNNVRNLRNAHKNDRGIIFNYLGSVRRNCNEIERTCPETGQLYHIDCNIR